MTKKVNDLNQFNLDFYMKSINGRGFTIIPGQDESYVIHGSHIKDNLMWPQSMLYQGKVLWFKKKLPTSLSVDATAIYVEAQYIDIEHDKLVVLSFVGTRTKYPFNYWLDLPFHELHVYFRILSSTNTYLTYTRLDTLVVSTITKLHGFDKRKTSNISSFVILVEEVARKRKMKFVIMENVSNEKFHKVLMGRYKYVRSTKPYHESTVLVKEIGEA